MNSNSVSSKPNIAALAAIPTLVFLILAGCVSGEVGPGTGEVERPDSGAAQQTPVSTPTASQPVSAPTISATATPPATSIPATATQVIPTQSAATQANAQATATQATATAIVQTPRILSTATRTPLPSPTPTATRVAGVAFTPTRTSTPTPVITDLPVQKQMSEAAFRTLMAAFDSGEIMQEEGCLPLPEPGDLKAEVLQSTRDDVEFDSYSLTGFPLPYIMLLDIELTLSGGYFDSTFEFPRNEELPGISSEREVVALINVCSNAKVPTTMNVESKDMRWTLYVLTGS